jgi:hypothetical protein
LLCGCLPATLYRAVDCDDPEFLSGSCRCIYLTAGLGAPAPEHEKLGGDET